MALFSAEAPWEKAASHIQVFNLYGGWVAHFPWEPAEATDDELQSIVTDLNRRGMAIGFEASPLVATEECGQGIEGFFGPEEGLRIVHRLKSLGATVAYVSLDEPFAFGHIYDGPNACNWTPEKIAQKVENYVEAIKSVYPGAIIGDNEPLWAGVDPEELIRWMDTYRAVTGSNLPFLHLDPDYSRADWSETAKQIEDAARARGIEFGIFYAGDAGDAADSIWLNKAFERARVYELMAGGKPDHVKFQSWNDHPDYLLPEENPDTFTALINRYFRIRTSLTLDLGSMAKDGSRNATGVLSDAMGLLPTDPTATVELTIKAVDGPGLVAEYTLTGIVPAGAIRSDVGFRVNTECGCRGASDFVLYRVLFVEGSGNTNLVPNSAFEQGMNGWGSWGNGRVRLESNDQGNGHMLHVSATEDQNIAINSAPFDVTQGATYSLTFVARIPPAAFGSGYFDITFQNAGGEFQREKIQLVPAVVKIGVSMIDTQGHYAISIPGPATGVILLEVNYPGNDEYWPAYASAILSP